MKSHLTSLSVWLSVILFVCIANVAIAQRPQNISASTQADLVEFVQEYPTCTDLPGYLQIPSLRMLCKLKVKL